MIKKIKIELLFIVLLIAVLLSYPKFDFIIFNELRNLKIFTENEYLKNFFINITKIGDSLWVFLSSILGFLFFYLKNKISKNKKVCVFKKLQYFFIFLFCATLTTGLITQIIKHVIGRPRPNHIIEEGVSILNLFSSNSSFHSFPSGHTSTIFIVALTLSLITPGVKYFYIFFACIIAFSRVVVEAHFFIDIIGGIVVASIGLKATRHLFNKFFKEEKLGPLKKINSSFFCMCLIIFFIVGIFLSLGSSLDIFISNLFYIGDKTFILQSFDLITIIMRKVFLPLIILYIMFFPIISKYLYINKLFFGYIFNSKEIIFIWSSFLFNLIVVINMLLKNLWGRARPNDILELGGKDKFTSWHQISDACSTNCSFVSGDASVGFSVIILFFITKNINFFWIALIAGFSLGITRILEGGHFVSDIFLAGFIIFIITCFQFIFFNKKINNDV